jgi:hypothetical protein
MKAKSTPRQRRNPLAKGYSRATISGNVAELIRAGRSRAQAVAASLFSARAAFKSKHPGKALPAALRPKGARAANPKRKRAAPRKASARMVTLYARQGAKVVKRAANPKKKASPAARELKKRVAARKVQHVRSAYRMGGKPFFDVTVGGKFLGTFASKARAVEIGQAYADKLNQQAIVKEYGG